jgi:hypothetical protein
MHVRKGRRGLSSLAAAVSVASTLALAAALAIAPPAQANAAAYPDYPDIELAAFWNSDQDLTDTMYVSNDGSDFQRISVPYQVDKGTDHVSGTPSYVHSLHDSGLFYVNGNFWMISGFVQKQGGLGYRFTPMLGSSKDLVHWSYPNSGSATNLKPTVAPLKSGSDGSFDTAGTDAMADADGSAWIVTTLGYFGANHGQFEHDTMMPYIVKASNVQPGDDQESDPGAQPSLNYGNLVPINLPDSSTNWLDPSLFKEGGTYYLSIKKNGVTNQIYSISDLQQAQNRNAWRLVNGNVVTGFEGPSLTKFKNQYYMYTDKLKDYPYGHADGKAGEFVTQSGSLASGWRGTRRITTEDVNGRAIPNRHGSVITVTDPAAKQVVWQQRAKAGYGSYCTDADGGAASSASSAASQAASQALGTPVPVYRLYNKHSGLHHYTTKVNECRALVSLGWRDEGISFNAAAAGSAKSGSLNPVYREYNPHDGNHNWTLNPSEHKTLVSLGWNDEGVAWYANPAGPVPVYRLYNPHSGEHVYTTSAEEYAVVGKAGWHQEGTAWKGL